MANINKEMNNEEIIATFSTCMDYISIYRNLSKFDKNHLPKSKIKDAIRFAIYKRNGYKTLVIWEKELKNLNKLKKKLLKF